MTNEQTRERRRVHPIQWAFLLALLVQVAAFAFWLGALSAKLDALNYRLVQVEETLRAMIRPGNQ
jgi:hypothetical protein